MPKLHSSSKLQPPEAMSTINGDAKREQRIFPKNFTAKLHVFRGRRPVAVAPVAFRMGIWLDRQVGLLAETLLVLV